MIKKLPSCLFVCFFLNVIFKVCHLSFFKTLLMSIFIGIKNYMLVNLWEILYLIFFVVDIKCNKQVYTLKALIKRTFHSSKLTLLASKFVKT